MNVLPSHLLGQAIPHDIFKVLRNLAGEDSVSVGFLDDLESHIGIVGLERTLGSEFRFFIIQADVRAVVLKAASFPPRAALYVSVASSP